MPDCAYGMFLAELRRHGSKDAVRMVLAVKMLAEAGPPRQKEKGHELRRSTMSEHNSRQIGKQSLASLVEEIETSIDFEVEEAKYIISDLIYEMMEANGINRAQLAESMQRSRPFITKLLSGSNNFEVSTLVHIARALNCKLNVKDLFLPRDIPAKGSVAPETTASRFRVEKPEPRAALLRPEGSRQGASSSIENGKAHLSQKEREGEKMKAPRPKAASRGKKTP